MNLAAVMVSVAEPNFKQKQDSKTRRADKLVFRSSPIGSTLLVFENSDFGWLDADFESIIDSLLLVLLPFLRQIFLSKAFLLYHSKPPLWTAG